MNLGKIRLRLSLVVCAVVSAIAVLNAPAQAQKFTVLHTFRFSENAVVPTGGLVVDGDGNLYGDSVSSVFELTPDSTLIVLGAVYFATGPIARGPGGDIYAAQFPNGGNLCGQVLKVTPEGSKVVLHNFGPSPDGCVPGSGLTRDAEGNLYGTTAEGGAFSEGTVWKINAADQSEIVLHSFAGGAEDGENPTGLVVDGSGNLYGGTRRGGAFGKGIVYRLAPNGQFAALHSFSGDDGNYPIAPLLVDAAGDLYGTTYYGGSGNCHAPSCGVLFKTDPAGNYTVLLNFGGIFGYGPSTALVQDRSGNLYGVSPYGGVLECSIDCGVLFQVAADGSATVLHTFSGGDGGQVPNALILSHGVLYGTANGGKFGLGIVFQYTLK